MSSKSLPSRLFRQGPRVMMLLFFPTDGLATLTKYNLQDLLRNLENLYPEAKYRITQLVSSAFALLSPESSAMGLPDFPVANVHLTAALLVSFKQLLTSMSNYFGCCEISFTEQISLAECKRCYHKTLSS